MTSIDTCQATNKTGQNKGNRCANHVSNNQKYCGLHKNLNTFEETQISKEKSVTSKLSVKTYSKNTMFYHGRGKLNCNNPTLRDDPFWLFHQKSYMYTYADTSELDTSMCWNLFTFKTTKNLKLINLGDKTTQTVLKTLLKNYPIPSNENFVKKEITNYFESDEYDDESDYGKDHDSLDSLIKYCFPSGFTRTSNSKVDLLLAKILKQFFSGYFDGWYVPEMDLQLTQSQLELIEDDEVPILNEEIMLFSPKDNIELLDHEKLTYIDISQMVDRCANNDTKEKCFKKVRQSFKENQIACLVSKNSYKPKCYFLEELVTDKLYSQIKKEINNGNMFIVVNEKRQIMV